MSDFGGHIRFTYSGSPLLLRGKLSTEPGNMKADIITNQDGSVSRSMTPKPYVADITFEDSVDGVATALDWGTIMNGGPYNISIIEDGTGVVHTYTRAVFGGDVKVDRMNGEVTGLTINSSAYSAKST